MNMTKQPSWWRRLVSVRRRHAGPDLGDMGTAFGLDAVMPACGDWSLVTGHARAASGHDGPAHDRSATRSYASTTNKAS